MKFIGLIFIFFSTLAQAQDSATCDYRYNYNVQADSTILSCSDVVINNLYGETLRKSFESIEAAEDFISRNIKFFCRRDGGQVVAHADSRFTYFSCYTKSVFLDSKKQ